MPPPILNDSEDEDDDVVYDDSRDGPSRSSGESVPGISALDDTRDTLNQSTGSTERLKRQLYDAQWSLCGNSSEQQQLDSNGNPVQANPVSPTVKRDKRRNSAVHHTEPAMSSVKRTKTINTYSSIKPSAASIEREQFLAAFGEDAIAPGTSPSIRFSDHSSARSSSGLPTGSLQAEFVNHEPSMFKDSGSTIPDNESSHERMVEQALRSKNLKATSSPGIKLVELDEMQKSSSFPWSASEQTPVTKSHTARDEEAAVLAPGADGGAEHSETPGQAPDYTQQPYNAKPNDESQSIPGPATAVMVAPNAQNTPHRSSPTVHINPVEIQAPIPIDPNTDSAEHTQKASEGRKRKVQEDSSEPLNSDDIAIGLPKERYKPRPSRRRATSVVEESIDYSVVPEKAAKSKRSKTTGSRRDSSGTQPQLSVIDLSPEAGRKETLVNDSNTAQQPTYIGSSKSIEKEAQSNASAKVAKSSPVVDVPATKEEPPSKPNGSAAQDEVRPASQSITTNSQVDDLAFVKPAPRVKSGSKSKRSSTTIFEDHVDLTGKARSPSLSQQQAIRHSNLVNVKDEASPVNRKRSRKAVIPDDDDKDEEEEEITSAKTKRTRRPMIVDDDDEDELSFDPNAQDERADEPPDPPPKKRGRGRPPKTPAKSDAEAAAKSAKQQDDENVGGDAQATMEEPPKKRRGRPPKSAAVISNTDDANDHHTEPQEDEVPASKSIESSAKEDSQPAKQNSAAEIPTPSPEKQQPSVQEGKKGMGFDKENKAASKASPPMHSPIKKSSSPAPYRVGLSKKHRIPSLLRVMRPPPQKRG